MDRYGPMGRADGTGLVLSARYQAIIQLIVPSNAIQQGADDRVHVLGADILWMGPIRVFLEPVCIRLQLIIEIGERGFHAVGSPFWLHFRLGLRRWKRFLEWCVLNKPL